MGSVKLFISVTLLVALFFSASSHANSATCLLLKQQMSSYQNSKTHPTYRSAQRDYNRLCNNPDIVEEPQTQSAKLIKNNNATTPLTEQEARSVRAQFEAVEASEAKQKLEVEELASEVLDSESIDTKQQQKPNNTSEQAPSHSVVKTSKPKPVKWQTETPEPVSLLDAMLMPLVLVVIVLVLVFIYVKFVRSRLDKLKEKAQEVTKDLAAIGSKVAEKKVKVKKGMLDPELYFRRQQVEVVLSNGDEVTLESVIVSQYGIFIVLPQKQRGAIIGSATLPQWKEQVGEELLAFDSPLQVVNQCSHSIGQIMDETLELEPIISFSDMAVFKSQFPIVVMHKKSVNQYVLGFKELKYSDQQVDSWLAKLDAYVAKHAEDKRQQAEQAVQKNLSRTKVEHVVSTPSPVESATQVDEHQTCYPEPGSYTSSVTEMTPDSQDTASVSTVDKSTEDHLAELDAILSKAKEFTEKLDDIAEAPSSNELMDINEAETQMASPEIAPVEDALLGFNAGLNSDANEPVDTAFTAKNSGHEFENGSGDDSPLTGDTKGDELSVLDSSLQGNIMHSEENVPENMVPHSEFKRRAAKRAVEDGMFDYLDHYSDGDKKTDFDENSDDLEQELAKSLEVGKGFLSELDAELSPKNAKSENELSSPDLSSKHSDHSADMDRTLASTHFEGTDLPAQRSSKEYSGQENNDKLTNLKPLSDDNDISATNPTNKQDGWRAIQAQLADTEPHEQTPVSVKTQEKSGWRALQDELAQDETDTSKPEEPNISRNDEDGKTSPFANLQLDPDWAPKPPPEKVFKTKPEDDPDNN